MSGGGGGGGGGAPAPAPLAAAYSETAEYRAMVTGMSAPGRSSPSSLPQVDLGGAAPATHVVGTHSLGIAVTDLAASAAFYAKLGLLPLDAAAPIAAADRSLRLRSASSGLELHLLRADAAAPGAANVLMDAPAVKPPGHTHASWSVASLPSMRAYLEAAGIALSGTRSNLAVFVRDPDRTTLEFERNDGGDEPVAAPDARMVGRGKPLDHVGVRIRAPFERHVAFWARAMGFTAIAHQYVADVEMPLKNFAPWITRTAAHVDVNFIPNCSTPVPAAGEASECALWAGGVVLPGILYVAYAIAEASASDALAALRAAGADAVLDTELGADWLPAWTVLPLATPTIMLRDLCGNVVRLVPRQRAP